MNNLEREAVGDWHRDPWGWPENRFLVKQPDLIVERLNGRGVATVALIDVPKENFAARPAMVLEPLDRLVYTALVDHFSKFLIGDLPPQVFGWRLSPKEPVKGHYRRNSDEWERFRHHLSEAASEYETLLVTDIVSCFANIPVAQVRDRLENHLPKGIPLERLLNLLEQWNASSGRTGLPQRSSSSAVLANTYMRDLDLVLQARSRQVGKAPRGAARNYSWARWMDDMWLFGSDAGALRSAQVDLQSEAASLGLNLNSSKTELLEGPEALQRALEMEHSAVDEELLFERLKIRLPGARNNAAAETPRLDELIDQILAGGENASRTTVRFATTRMRNYKKFGKVQDLLECAERMPHCADHLARLFRDSVGVADYQDWFLQYTKSPWSSYEWSIANFGTALKSGGRPPRRATREYFAGVLADGRTSLPLFALAAQRLSGWDRDGCRLALREAVRSTSNPHHLRVAALAGLACGEPRSTTRRWLAGPENRLTLQMLESFGYRAPKPSHDYAGDG